MRNPSNKFEYRFFPKFFLFFSKVLVWFLINLVLFVALLIIHFKFRLSIIPWWPDVFSVAINVISGGLVSFFFYYLVVYYPEKRKKAIIKANLLSIYWRIKRNILFQIIFASQKGGRTDLSTNIEDVENLMKVEAFKSAFSGGRLANEGFYAFENQMSNDTIEFRNIILNLTFLSRQIEYVLHNYPILDERLFDIFKTLDLSLLRLQNSEPGYDESKGLCGFIYEIFAGWSTIDGYIGYDRIEKVINSI